MYFKQKIDNIISVESRNRTFGYLLYYSVIFCISDNEMLKIKKQELITAEEDNI